MSTMIKQILADLYEIDPNLAEKEEELKKIIGKLLSSKPDATIDEDFQTVLKRKILKKISRKQPAFITWVFRNKLKIALSAAAGIFSAVIIFSVLLPVIASLQTNQNKNILSGSYEPEDEDMPVPGDDETVISEREEEESVTGSRDLMVAQGKSDDMDDKTITNGEKGKTTEKKEETIVLKDLEADQADDEDAMKAEDAEGIIGIRADEDKSGDIDREILEEIALLDDITVDSFDEFNSVPEEDYEEPVTEETERMKAKEAKPDTGGDDWNTEEYDRIYENRFLKVTEYPESTFSIDVDTASYANVRRFLKNSQLPYKDAVRIEELINYFPYDYPQPSGTHPFAFFTETSDCPWNTGHRLIHIGIQGKIIPPEQLPPSNLVFLIDVSGSMNDSTKLPLLKSAFTLLVNELREQDRVAIVVYAGAAGLVLPSTPGNEKSVILDSLYQLSAGGSTAGGAGIQLAYNTAMQYYNQEGNNRVILATDGDFNIGASSDAELTRLIEEKRDQGVFLTVLGFGMGNYKDSKMEKLADKGNGNYAYIDTFNEAKKVLVTELGSTLLTIAKDVKIQIEFNPVYIQSYRLIGYENRVLAKEDFEDDTKDAGELGAGHTVTALYEIIPGGSTGAGEPADEMISDSRDLKYQETSITDEAYASSEIMTLKFRYKKPDQDTSIPVEVPVIDEHTPLTAASDNFRFSAAVAEWGLLLRDSEYKGDASYDHVLDLARGSKGMDSEGYRAEFIELVEISKLLAGMQ